MGLFGKIAGAFRDEPPRAPLGRNEPCWCGSGKKYKQCHIDRDRERAQARGKAPCASS